MAFDKRALRDAFGSFLTGVTVVTTTNAHGEPSGLTANSFSSVSLDPPLVLFSLARDADCFEPFQRAEHFAVNVLERSQAELSNRFATKSGEKWSGVGFRRGAGGCPLIPGALASFVCRVRERHEGGDHVIYVGEIVALETAGEGSPLAFYRGEYRELL